MPATSENALSRPRAGRPEALEPRAVDAALDRALREDLGGEVGAEVGSSSAEGDVTSESVLDASCAARARLVAKAEGVVAGLGVFARAFERVDAGVRVSLLAQDGDRVRAGDELARVAGPARAILTAERTALNFVQRMSGVATATARLVALAGGRARVLDTRKTTPGLRLFERYAVRCGGGENHRTGLFDEVMIKDNHLDLAGVSLTRAVERARARVGRRVRVTVEARTEAEAVEAVRSDADVVLLDNFAPDELARLVPRLRSEPRAAAGDVELEASGGIDERNLADFAATGVDRISVGAPTHSPAALDLSLVVERAS